MNKVSLLHSGVIEMCLKIKLVLLLASETCKEVTNMLCLMCGMVTCCVYLVWLCCIPVKQVAEMFAHRTAGRTVQLKKWLPIVSTNCTKCILRPIRLWKRALQEGVINLVHCCYTFGTYKEVMFKAKTRTLQEITPLKYQ